MRFLVLCSLVLCVACRTVKPAWSIETQSVETRRHTTEGDVVGGMSKNGGFAWLGIPFAQPPVGELRWKPPLAPKPRAAVLPVTRYARACAQVDNILTINEKEHDGILGDEDCLYLNVFAPPNAHGLPVMMWIHGGGNSLGSSANFDFSPLAVKQNVVVVTMQYRLGPLGWLSHPALKGDGAGGNYGTLDQVRALEWLKDNAAAFGGDPGNITVFGESAGGTNTYAMLLSPKAKGLFHRAISQSPFLSRTTLTLAEAFTEAGGHPNSSNETLLRAIIYRGAASDRASAKDYLARMKPEDVTKFFRSMSAPELIRYYAEGAPRNASMLDLPNVFPDGEVMPAQGWFESFSSGAWNKMPVIAGSNRDEMKLLQLFDPRYVYMLFGFLPRMRDPELYEATASKTSRVWRAWCVDAVAQAMIASGWSDVWSYRFDWDEERSLLGTDVATMLGAGHGVEIPFVQGTFEDQIIYEGDAATVARRDELSEKMMANWAAFARDGKPLPEWTRYDTSSPTAGKYLTLDVPLDKVKMSPGVEDGEGLLVELLKDERVKTAEKCAGLLRLVRIGFVSQERADRVTECTKSAQ
jgi:para-nitrobenzyl esterase